MYLTYVLNADRKPLMPCHPARARELVRRGRAYWVRRDTVQLNSAIENPSLQKVTVGIDSGAEHIGLAGVRERSSKAPQVIFRALVEARPMREIKDLMDERRSYRRGRRSRQWYREPWLSPTQHVGLSAKLYDKDGQFLYRIPVCQGKHLCRPDKGGRQQATRIGGNRFRLLTRHQESLSAREQKPGKRDILVYGCEGNLLTWYDPKRGDLAEIERRLLGKSGRHHDPIATVEQSEGHKVFRLLSRSAERSIPKAALPNPMPPFRKFGQKRKPTGWLSPAAMALANAHARGLEQLRRYIPVHALRLEVAAFDTQKLNDPEIEGVGYQEPKLYAGQNRKNFILARDNWTCVYCGKKNVPLTVDHIVPKHPETGRAGSDHVGNLVAACQECQEDKGNVSLEEFLRKRPRDAKRVRDYVASLPKQNQVVSSAANIGQIKSRLISTLNAESTWGYVTKKDRIAMGLPKSHDMDAVAIAARGRKISVSMPSLRVYHIRRFTKGKASRRQKYKANPLGVSRLGQSGFAPAFVGTGERARWVQRIGVNPRMNAPAGTIHLRDLVRTTDGRIGYVMKLNSSGSITLSRRPIGKDGHFSTSVKKIANILRKRTGLLEDLSLSPPFEPQRERTLRSRSRCYTTYHAPKTSQCGPWTVECGQ